MTAIFKYQIFASGLRVEMPLNAEILAAREQRDCVCIWARVEPSETRTEVRVFQMFGTGHTIPVNMALKYLGTAVLHEGDLVLHVFEHLAAASIGADGGSE